MLTMRHLSHFAGARFVHLVYGALSQQSSTLSPCLKDKLRRRVVSSSHRSVFCLVGCGLSFTYPTVFHDHSVLLSPSVSLQARAESDARKVQNLSRIEEVLRRSPLLHTLITCILLGIPSLINQICPFLSFECVITSDRIYVHLGALFILLKAE